MQRIEKKPPPSGKPGNALVIPIKVNFLLVHENDEPLAEARIDFSKLPFNDGREDVNSEFAYISENFISQPFQNRNLVLQSGLHLHWALPDAFTKGKIAGSEDKKQVRHSPVPDRWIINKKSGDNIEKSWIVESNYLHPESNDNYYDAISYPVETGEFRQPFRYMGRSYLFYDSKNSGKLSIPNHSEKPEYLDEISVAGYGEPSFAAFYPNCRSVFGFCDPEIMNESDLENIHYEILGWFSDPRKDPLSEEPSGLSFDGKRDYISLPNIPLAANRQFTLEAMIYPTTGQDNVYRMIIGHPTDRPSRPPSLYIFNGNQVRAGFGDGKDWLFADSPAVLRKDSWNHIAVTYDGTRMEIFINGASASHTDSLANKIPSLQPITVIGKADSASGCFDGFIKHIRIWNIKRTTAEINLSIDKELGPQPGLLAEYKFNYGPAGKHGNEIIPDSSGNGYHGKLIGFDSCSEAPDFFTPALERTLKENFRFILNADPGSIASIGLLPVRTLCFAELQFDRVRELSPPEPASIVIGNTGTEAISAWLGRQLSVKEPRIAEDELNALQLIAKMSGKKLDIKAVHEEAFHENEFSPTGGGHIWRLYIESASEKNNPGAGRKQGIEITLPASFAYLINDLNLLQQDADRMKDELMSLEHQLYADWCKYMIASYHPDIEKGLPQADDIRFFIKSISVKEIERKKEMVTDAENRIIHKLQQVYDLIGLFNQTNHYNVGILNPGGSADATKEKFFSKLISEKSFSFAAADQQSSGNQPDEDLEGIFVKMINEEKDLWESKNEGHGPISGFNAVSIWVLINSHQATDNKSKIAGDLIQLNLSDKIPGEPVGGTLINADGVGNYWQSVYINGKTPNAFETIQWDDFPKDQWTHVYLEGSYVLKQSVQLSLMKGLRGKLAGVRIFNARLTSTEVFCDMNMLLLKKMSLSMEKGPRYWQPTDPVILIAGDIARPSDRYGFDGDLPCFLFTPPVFDPIDISDYYFEKYESAFLEKLSSLKDLTSTIKKLGTTFPKFIKCFLNVQETEKPWHPLLMEWKIAIIPTSDNSVTTGFRIPQDFITRNYLLNEDNPDLILRPGHDPEIDAVKIFSGTSILTPHAKSRMIKVIEKYLENIHKDDEDWQNFVKPPGTEFNPFINEKGQADPGKIRAVAFKVSEDDTRKMAITLKAYLQLCNNDFLSQSLGGFNAAMLMLHQAFQLPIADPIGFPDDQDFTEKVKSLVRRQSKFAPLPLFEFDPVRTGQMKVLELNIIDSFGQIRNVYSKTNDKQGIYFAKRIDAGNLVPRISQPARINFRWLSSDNEMEMNDHPVSSPVCGWLLPNNLDRSLMVYDEDGNALGAIAVRDSESKLKWQSVPGANHPITFEQIQNPFLKNVVNNLLDVPDIPAFIELLVKTMDQVDPENFAQHTDIAMLLGRPIAIVRASVGLEVKGNFAINQDWGSLEEDMIKAGGENHSPKPVRTTNGWEQIKFPVRIGEHGQLNDGVLGYWLDNAGGVFQSVIHADDSEINAVIGMNTNSKGFDPNSPAILISLSETPVLMTLLMDPRGTAHAICGVVPAKVISIPDDQFKPSLKNMSVTFFTRPLLMPGNKVAIPLPDELGYNWSWLVQSGNNWTEVSTIGIVHKETFEEKFHNGKDIWDEMIAKGWIEQIGNNKASVVPSNQRTVPDPGSLIIEQLDKIQQLLDEGHIVDVEYSPDFNSSNQIREGWLKLTPGK